MNYICFERIFFKNTFFKLYFSMTAHICFFCTVDSKIIQLSLNVKKDHPFIISLQQKSEVKNSPFKAGLALNKASSSSSRMTSRPCPRAASQTNHFKTVDGDNILIYLNICSDGDDTMTMHLL